MLEQTQKLIADSIQAQTKVVSLFQFIRELNKLKQNQYKCRCLNFIPKMNEFHIGFAISCIDKYDANGALLIV